MPVHPSLGKELCILCWAVEDASPDNIPNALYNWEALAAELAFGVAKSASVRNRQALEMFLAPLQVLPF